MGIQCTPHAWCCARNIPPLSPPLTSVCPCDRGTSSISSLAATTATSASGTYAPAAATGRTSRPAGWPPAAAPHPQPLPPHSPTPAASVTQSPGRAKSGAPVRCTATTPPWSTAQARKALRAETQPPAVTHARTRTKDAHVRVTGEAAGVLWVKTFPAVPASALTCAMMKQCSWAACMARLYQTGIHRRQRLTA